MAIKEVYFNLYCPTCKHYTKREDEDPCYDCLDQGWNEDSHKPIKYEEDKKNADKKSSSGSTTV